MTWISPRHQAIMREQQRAEEPDQASDVWEALRSVFKDGKILPIIGNSVLNKMVFPTLVPSRRTPPAGESESPAEEERAPPAAHAGDDGAEPPPDETNGKSASAARGPMPATVNETLAGYLAIETDYPYPFADFSSLARVTQFIRYAKETDPRLAKRDYLQFLKRWLLNFAEEDPVAAPLVPALRANKDTLDRTFSDLATALGYPRPPPGREDPLDLLARLPLSVYVTTSYYDFLERALRKKGREPETHVCYWNREPTSGREEGDTPAPYPDFRPTVKKPAVYHLFGVESDPESLVLSEDDYLAFLVKVARESQSILPTYLKTHLNESSLILVGYRPQDWDFRILVRGVISCCINTVKYRSVAIQLTPTVRDGSKAREAFQQKAEAYIEKYFGKLNFEIQWMDEYDFTASLLERWARWTGVQL